MLATTHGPNFNVCPEGFSQGWPTDELGWEVFFRSEFPNDPEFAQILFESFMNKKHKKRAEDLDFGIDDFRLAI
jgi:hypothetical protein